MAKKKLNGHRAPKLYKAYWFRGRDPIMDLIKAEVQRTVGNQRIDYKKLREMEMNGGPSVTTMSNQLLKRTVQRPQNATVEATLRSIGMKRVIVKG